MSQVCTLKEVVSTFRDPDEWITSIGIHGLSYTKIEELRELKNSHADRVTRQKWLYGVICEWDNFRYGADMNEESFINLTNFLFGDSNG